MGWREAVVIFLFEMRSSLCFPCEEGINLLFSRKRANRKPVSRVEPCVYFVLR